MNEIESVIESLKEKKNRLHEVYAHLSHGLQSHGWNTFRIPGHHLKHFLKLREGEESQNLCENHSFFGSLLDGFHLHSRVSTEKELELNHTGVCTDPSTCSCPTPCSPSLSTIASAETKVPQMSSELHEMSLMDTILDTLHLKPPEAPTAVEEEVMRFHEIADQVQRNLRNLQKIVLCKYHQKRVNRKFYGPLPFSLSIPSVSFTSPVPTLSCLLLSCLSDPLERVDNLREDWWLEILVKKYRSEYLTPEENQTIAQQIHLESADTNGQVDAVEGKGHPYLPPICHFSAFLSCCLIKEIDCTSAEERALQKVTPPLPSLSLSTVSVSLSMYLSSSLSLSVVCSCFMSPKISILCPPQKRLNIC